MRKDAATRAKTEDAICELLAEGMSLREICRGEDMPAISAVMRWLAESESFQEHYARAKEVGIEAMAGEILEISDNAHNDWMIRHGDEDAGWQANGEHIQRSKLRVDSRKWLLSKLAPKKYGDRTTLAGDADNPLIPTIIQFVRDSTPPE